MRLNYPRTFLLGFGFFVISVVSSLYNSYVPVFYDRFLDSRLIIGLFMVIDNIAAITLQPVFGAFSDNTWNRFGRRMPYLLAGLPMAAFFFMFMPVADTLTLLVTLTILMNVGMSIARAPAIALMPDVTPSPLRSKANGVINFMGGVGAVLVFLIGSKLYATSEQLPFIFASVLLVLIPLLLWKFIREPEDIEKSPSFNLWHTMDDVVSSPDKSGLYLLLAILFWFIGYSGVEAQFTLYAGDVLGLTPAQASFNLAFLAGPFVLFAIPSGFIATRFGRKPTILAGLVGMAIMFLGVLFFRDISLIRLAFVLTGVSWALININSYPMVVEMAGKGETGAFTGLYYIASSVGFIIGPPLFGGLMDRIGVGTLFLWGVLAFLASIACMLRVKRGEAVPAGPIVTAPEAPSISA